MIGCLALLVLRPPHVKPGDHWSAERTLRFVSKSAEIDMQNDDHFDYVVSSNGLTLQRMQTGTHLPDGTLVPTPTGGQAVETVLPMTGSVLDLPEQPDSDLERMLTDVYITAWNASGAVTKFWTISVKQISSTEEHVRFEQTPAYGSASLEGEIKLDPSTHVPVAMTLSGRHFMIPGGGDRVSIQVGYTAKRVGA